MVDEGTAKRTFTQSHVSCYVRVRAHAIDMICDVRPGIMCFQLLSYYSHSHSSLGLWFQREEGGQRGESKRRQNGDREL